MQDDELDFCKICLNKKYELSQGIYCGLTNKKPDFDKKCPSFNLDVEKKIEEIENSWRANKESFPNGSIYIDSEFKLRKYIDGLSGEYKIIRSATDAFARIIVFPIFTTLLIAGFLNGEFSWELFKRFPYILIGIFYILSIPLSLWGINIYRNKNPIITLSLENGITIHEKGYTLPWSSIVCTYINMSFFDYSRIELRFNTYDKDEPIEYVLPEINIPRKKLIYLAEAYRIKYQKQALTLPS